MATHALSRVLLSSRALPRRVRALATASTPSPSPAAAAPSPQPVAHVLLDYIYDAAASEELAARRAPLRPAHLAHANAARARGELLLGGAVSGGGNGLGGLLVFRGVSEEAVRAFALADPYVAGRVVETGRPLVRSWSTRSWAVVISCLR
jgi:hypothetical protein